MEHKKRKKARKKNRSGHLEVVQEAAAPLPSFENLNVALLGREGDAIPAAEEAAGEGIPPDEPFSALQESSLRLADPTLRPVERQQIAQIVQELRSAFDSEARNSPVLCVLLNDIKASHATSQANLDYSIEQLRGELVYLNQAVNSQKRREVDLDVEIQGLREEVLQLKAMQQAEREREEAEYVEIQQLREEMAKLSEGSLKQLRMVEAMSDNLQQLLKHGQARAPMGLTQLAHNPAVCTPFASEAGMALSSEIPKDGGLMGLLEVTDLKRLVEVDLIIGANREQWSLTVLTQSGKGEAVAIDSSMASCETERSELNEALVLPQLTEAASATLVDELGVENPEKVNGYHALMNDSIQQENNMNQQSEQTKSFEMENHAHSTSSGNPSVNHLGACMREVPTTYLEAERTKKDEVHDRGLFANNTDCVNKKQVDDRGLFVDTTESISVLQEQQKEKNHLYHELTPKTIQSGMALHAHLQGTELKPLSDAPITGAPIRLFRFVARYVSGADLVQ